MVVDHLFPPEKERYLQLRSQLEAHLVQVPLNHRTSLDDSCPSCTELVTRLVPLISLSCERKNHPPSPVIEEVNPFAACVDESQLDKMFHASVPPETQTAAALLHDSKYILRTFGTVATHRDDAHSTNAYFPQGVQKGLKQIASYAARKYHFVTTPKERSDWFKVTDLCSNYL
jgi:hypothetical protein